MKRIKYLIFIFACILFIGCNQQNSTANEAEKKGVFNNPVQEDFMRLLSKYYVLGTKESNKLAKDELYEKYQLDIKNFLDTAKIINWSFYFDDISSRDESEEGITYKHIQFSLKNNDYSPSVTCYANYYVNVDSLGKNKIYDLLKKCSKGDVLVFSGFFTKNNKGYYAGGLDISRPTFDITILDLSKAE